MNNLLASIVNRVYAEQQQEQEFIIKIKKNCKRLVENMLEAADINKDNMREGFYIELMKHLKMTWDLIDNVNCKEEAIEAKETTINFWDALEAVGLVGL